MKISNRASHYTRRTSLLVLETDDEEKLTDGELLLICDNLEGIEYNNATGSYDLTGEKFGDCKHFGGSCQPAFKQRTKGSPIEVTVYTD